MKLLSRRWIEMTASAATYAVIVIAIVTQLPANAQFGPTNEECQANWEMSDASHSCGKAWQTGPDSWTIDTSGYWVMASSNGGCGIQVDCAREDASQEPTYNDVVFAAMSTSNLKNCDGTVKLTANC